MIEISETKMRLLNKNLKKTKREIAKIQFKDVARNKDGKNFRQCDLTVDDILNVTFGKAVDSQNNSISCVIKDITGEGFFDSELSSTSFEYRKNQIDPDSLLEVLLKKIAPQTKKGEYIKTIFDGSSVSLPNKKEIEEKYPKTKSGKTKSGNKWLSKNPMCKIHYMSTENENICFDVIRVEHNISERVALVTQALNANKKGLKLDIMADRGLYGAMPGYLIDKLGHKFLLRIGGGLVKRAKNGKFVNDEMELDLKIYRSSIKPYSHLFDDLKAETFRCRIVRKKGKGKHKPIYLMTNITDKNAASLLARYNKRQRVEDTFKYLKSYGGLEKLHFNTGLQLTELLMVGIIFYLSLLNKFLYEILPTPGPDQDGEEIPNRKSSWKIFFKLLRPNITFKLFCLNVAMIFSSTLKIRTGRRHDRFKYYNIRKKK